MNREPPSTRRTEHDWLEFVRTSVLRGDVAAAHDAAGQARAEYPDSLELRRLQAGIFQQAGRIAEAEAALRELLAQNPGDVATAFTLAEILRMQGRMAGAASVMRACFSSDPNLRAPDLLASAIELLDQCDRKADAAAIAKSAVAGNPGDTRLPAYAGMLQMQLGEFDSARQHYLSALERDDRAWEWHVPIGLSAAQRYASSDHPDFALFRQGLQRSTLSDKARAELHFALGKAHDDIGNYEEAARHFREGNAIMHRLAGWSRKNWRRSVQARLAAGPIRQPIGPCDDFTPIFIVGMPRSGTTLLAELLSRHPRVCNRGELPWIADLASRYGLLESPKADALRRAAAVYTAQSRQDDSDGARWFIDKQPLNFRYIDLMLAMFPAARVIHCQRNERDVALSLWTQCFLEEVQGYSYDFGDMTLVMRDCKRLISRWQDQWPDAIRTVRYEELVANSRGVVESLAGWIGFPIPQTTASTTAPSTSTISTASLWQARQPVNSRSVGRWNHYIGYLPELLRFADDEPACRPVASD